MIALVPPADPHPDDARHQPSRDDATRRIGQAIGALDLIRDGMGISIDWCGLSAEETSALRAAVATIDDAQVRLLHVVLMIRRRDMGIAEGQK